MRASDRLRIIVLLLPCAVFYPALLAEEPQSKKAAEKITSANEAWKFVKDQAEPVIVGSPCRESPPTVIITTSDGKRELIVGKQAALPQVRPALLRARRQGMRPLDQPRKSAKSGSTH